MDYEVIVYDCIHIVFLVDGSFCSTSATSATSEAAIVSPIQTCLAAIDVIKRIKTEVIHHSTEDKRYTLATKIVLTKGLIETIEDEKDLIHGQAAHKCQRILQAAKQKHHTILIDSTIFDEIKNHRIVRGLNHIGERFRRVSNYQKV